MGIKKIASLSEFDLRLINDALDHIAPVLLVAGELMAIVAFQALREVLRQKGEELATSKNMAEIDPIGYGQGLYD